jgi:hypothetical protein
MQACGSLIHYITLLMAFCASGMKGVVLRMQVFVFRTGIIFFGIIIVVYKQSYINR